MDLPSIDLLSESNESCTDDTIYSHQKNLEPSVYKSSSQIVEDSTNATAD